MSFIIGSVRKKQDIDFMSSTQKQLLVNSWIIWKASLLKKAPALFFSNKQGHPLPVM